MSAPTLSIDAQRQLADVLIAVYMRLQHEKPEVIDRLIEQRKARLATEQRAG